MEIVWMDSAIADLDRLREFIGDKNRNAAERISKVILEAISKVEQCPHIGKPVKELEFFHDFHVRFGAGGYVLRYRIFEDIIYLIHLRHYRELDFKS